MRTVRRTLFVAAFALTAVACEETGGIIDAGVTDANVPDSGPVAAPTRPIMGSRIHDRAGRPFMNHVVVAPGAATDVDEVRGAYNTLMPADYFPGQPLNQGTDARPQPARFILPSVGLYDALDGVCGQGNLTSTATPDLLRYQELAGLLADDRIWLDTSSSTCATYLAVESRAYGFGAVDADDCGGRMPRWDVLDATLTWLSTATIADAVTSDDRATSSNFPYFAAP